MKKTLPTSEIENQLAGSVFFRKDKPKDSLANQPTTKQEKKQTRKEEVQQDTNVRTNEHVHHQLSSSKPTNHDVVTDVMTSLLQDVNLKNWQEIIENTETQNSSLRLTKEERYAVEDVINELQRKEKIITSMNEIARLGLLFLIHDFKQQRSKSLLYTVKKA